MDILSAVTTIVADLLIFVGAMAILLVVLVLIVARLPADNPLRRVLAALCYRVAATLGAGFIAIPLEPIPGVDAVYDIAAPILLLIYWISFFRFAFRRQMDERR